MSALTDEPGYRFSDAGHCESHGYLLPALLRILQSADFNHVEKRLFEVGCGNGSIACALADRGFEIAGIDPSPEGIAHANASYPDLRLESGSAYDDLAGQYGRYPIVVSLEVVEHVYAPRKYASTIYDLLLPGGMVVISTPFHGYWKNLALAVTGKMDAHFTALWDNGHIKFWSEKTLRRLLVEAGFEVLYFERVGRVPVLAKSMIAVARKPSA